MAEIQLFLYGIIAGIVAIYFTIGIILTLSDIWNIIKRKFRK